MSSEELKPCPFCGSPAKSDNGFLPAESITYAWCSNTECQLHSVDVGMTPADWNRRVLQKVDPQQPAPAQGVTGLVEAISPALHWAGSFHDTWPEDSEYPDGAWVVGAVSDGEQYPIITVNADQYDAPGDSEKIARAIIALWATALAAHVKQSGGAWQDEKK